MIEIQSWIIDFKNYIYAGYEEVPKKGHYTQMQPIIDDSRAIALDRKDANEKDLNTLCTMLLEEGKKRMPHHQRRI